MKDENNLNMNVTKQKIVTYSEKIKPHLIANTFFHYTDQLKYIKEALKEKKLYPRYSLESYNQWNNTPSPLTYLLIPMKCFCDIKLHNTESHTDFYGCYGLGFKRKWGFSHQLESVSYAAPESSLVHLLFNQLSNQLDTEDDLTNIQENYLLKSLFYLKPISGPINNEYEQRTTDSSNIDNIKYFRDENESRYIPDLSNTELPQYLNNFEIKNLYLENKTKFKNKKEELNKKLKEFGIGALDFEYSDLKYILVKNKEDKNELINFIDELELNKKSKYNLIAKIEVFQENLEDY